MSTGTFVVLVLLVIVVTLVVRSMIKDKKAGKSLQCGMNCSKCSGHCAQMARQNGGKPAK